MGAIRWAQSVENRDGTSCKGDPCPNGGWRTGVADPTRGVHLKTQLGTVYRRDAYVFKPAVT